ncbi:MAG: helix-turn-helix transcriptional regulator [Sphingopyxis sp.]|jgi:predicted DNA-binding transcriptional regulator AlpA
MASPNDDNAAARAAKARSGMPFLNPEQTAFYLGLTTRTLQEYRSNGTGPRYRRHGRFIRYHIDDIDAWALRDAKGNGDA